MPGKIKVKILAGRNLPVMDRSGDTTDAYVELKFGNITYKTDVCRKSLNPQWNSDWYRFEVDDSELQDEPLQIRLMDHDTYSANDAIGKVYINLNPLLLPGVPPTVKNIWTLEAAMNTNAGSQSGSVMTGWIPVYDTMHGIRGEVNIIVKVELFSDFNKFRQSSCGVQFFNSPNIPHGYHTQSIHGFVEELVVSDDPEYKWIDKIRTPRASNEARQTLFFKLSGEVQRKIGLKALDLGGNAVIGYLQNFDLEGESGIVARGIGTAVTLVKLQDTLGFPSDNIEETYFSQHKAQKERTGVDESMPLYPISVNHIPDPLFANMRGTRIKSSMQYHLRVSKSPRKIVKKIECPYHELAGVKFDGSNSAAISYPTLSESVVQDASIRMMLALEDERGETSKNILDVRKNLKRFFSTSDAESKGSNSRLSSSARSSIVSIPFPRKEKVSKDSKATGVAALLIKSIHSVPLENVEEIHEITGLPSKTNGAEHIDNVNKQENERADGHKNSIRCASPKIQTKKEHDSSFEENTPSSNGFTDASSIDSASYNILSDPKFSSDERLGAIVKLSKVLRRSHSFPPLKIKSTQIKLQRTDSDIRPVHEDNTSLPLVRRPSTNQISMSNLEFVASRAIEEDPGHITSPEFNKNMGEGEVSQSHQSTDNSQDLSLPLATSTPVELQPPFLCEVQQADCTIMDAVEKLSIRITDFEESNKCYKQFLEIPINKEYQNTSTDADNAKNDDLSCADDSEASVPAYPLLQSAPDTACRDKRAIYRHVVRDKRYPSMIEEVDESTFRDSFKDKQRSERLEERDILKLTLSTQSLPALQQYQYSAVKFNAKNGANSKLTPETMSKTSSSIESLIQSSGNEIFDVVHKNRQRRMLDLIRIIDTKMMVQPVHHSNNEGRVRRKNRDKVYRNFTPRTLHKNLHNQCLKKHLHSNRHVKIMRASSFSKRHPSNASRQAPITPDSSSYNSSLESIIIRDTLNQTTHSRRMTESFHSKSSFTTKRSAVDQKSREIAAIEFAADTQSSDSLKHNSSIIEMKQLKPNDTNISMSSTSIDHAAHESHSICNIREMLDHDELTNSTNTANITYNSCVSRPSSDHRQQDEAPPSPSYPILAVPPMVSKVCQLPASKAQPTASLHRRSSDSDLSITPKGNSLGANDRSMTGFLKTSTAVIRTMNQDAFEMLEYPFITMQQYPPGFILHIGGLVSSRSVKLLERISNLEEPESRDAWWKEVRMEVRSHARALACNVVIGYREETSICDDVCVLNAYGTAAVINLHSSNQDSENVFICKGQSGSGANPADVEKPQQKPVPTKGEKSDTEASVPTLTQTGKVRHTSESREHEAPFQSKCSLCHLPYNEASVPFRVNVSKCAVCKRARVPDVMFTTIELPENLLSTGRGCIIQATACKTKKDLRGELNAKEISDCLPFLEYELHSLVLNKLKVKGMNAIFGLKLQVSVGERLIIGMAVGTAVFLTALPTPPIPQIASGNSWHKEEQLAEIQKTLVETVKQNREFYRLKPVVDVENGRVATSDTDDSDNDLPDLDFSVGPRDTCVLEVDDIEDMDRISLLMDDRPPEDFHVVNTQSIPGLDDLEIVRNLQMFTQISRTKIPAGQFASMPSKYFTRLLQSVYFKLRRMIPCALCDMQFKLALPEPDEIQFTVIGMALGLGDPVKMNKCKKKPMSHSVSKDQVKKPDDSDMIFNLDVDHTELSSDNASSSNANSVTLINAPALKSRSRSPLRSKIHTTHKHKHVPLKGRYGVDITPLSYLPGGRIERYLGNLNFFFIRESTSIRENGGLSGFTHSFVMEVLAIVRAYITALGGNAMVAFFMTKCVLFHNPHKNQGQCLINVGGDVVSVSYFANEKHCAPSNC